MNAVNQKWAFLPLDSGYYKIVNKNSGKCLQIPETLKLPNGRQIEQHEFNGTDRQKWRLELVGAIKPDENSLQFDSGSAIEASCRIFDATREFKWYLLNGQMPSINAIDLMNLKTGNCREESQYLTYLSRALGIPVTQDFTPSWPHRSLGHDWNVVFDRNGKAIKYYFGNKPGQHTMYDDWPKAKVFRKIFSENPESLAKQAEESDIIPELFQSPHFIDVTHEYVETNDVTVELEFGAPQNARFAYLCTFNNQDWEPIYWGEIENNKVTFKNMGRNIMYLPVFYSEKGFYVAGRVFLLSEEGKVNQFIADSTPNTNISAGQEIPAFSRCMVPLQNDWRKILGS